jgi:hypothetical protein
LRIEEALRHKLQLVPTLTIHNYRQMVREEHFPY